MTDAKPSRSARRTRGIYSGACVDLCLAGLDFPVIGWSRTPKSIPGIDTAAGADRLADSLGRADIVVAVLPSTPATRCLMDAKAFAAMRPDGYFINVGRGDLVVEADLLAALESGRLAGAALDVHRAVPLRPDHPFWAHPKIVLTPHVAAGLSSDSCIPEVARIYRLVRDGRLPETLVDPERGY